MRTAIVGFGFVGKAMGNLFPDALIYDPYANIFPTYSRDDINQQDVAFVCVPTNQKEDGSCDTSIVEETVDWLKTPLIIIRSTVKPGTTERLIQKYPDKQIVFVPEYVGETVAHPLLDESERTFLILGGRREASLAAYYLFQTVYNASVRVFFMTPTEAEIVKYMENTAIATMVTLVNEFYNICEVFGVDYEVVREGFLADPRMSRYFTFVYPNKRGFDGKCLPKDLNAIVRASSEKGYSPSFIESVLASNRCFRHD